jgi:DNA repair exonuclease SbcCD ATPase subunit
MTSKKYMLFALVAVTILFLAACSSNKEPAAAAIKAAEDAFNATKTEAMKFVPDQVKSVEDAIKAAKASFEKGNFDEALNTAKAAQEKVKEMIAAVAARKENLAKNWAEISGGVPEMLEAVKSRLDSLKASKKLPKSMDKAKLEQAEMHYEVAALMWDEAKKAFSGGNPADVIPLATAAKEDAVKAMELLELQMPAAATK